MVTKKRFKKKIDRNRDLIQKVLDSMNEGDLTPAEAKEFITMLSKKNEGLIEQLSNL